MEQILSMLKQLTSAAGMLGQVPRPIKRGLLMGTVALMILAVFKYAPVDKGTKTFLIIALVMVGVIVAAYQGWKKLKEKQASQGIRNEISQHSSATPRSLSDPGQRARLDDMRKKFQSGVEAYKSRGKDLYKLPWYVIVGEPGSGKTEAVRHSNVGFPPGMQDEFQGVGGTINMNWWFTNHAVLLDTAGRLMFEDVKPGETSEWKEFLTLLKKNRPNCPINGLFLVIPSDSLIKDDANAIQKKAGKIAQQLDVIQRVLDVRFPVFVIVTKCDKINGFREFFDTVTDPQLQHQMMGWSNPAPLDEPFKPEMVDKHLEQVAGRLRRRRLGLMRDPIPENPEGRRTDEVDTLYAFPHSLEMLASRLRRYLETIFIAGEWSAKPLFLRGIYFSSSMREGSALDAELAEAIGVAVEELPEGKVWERERAYFLRDLFLEKVFREKGLVTRATNTRHMLRTQQIMLYGVGFLALAGFCTIAYMARKDLNASVKDRGDYWSAVSSNGWEGAYWSRSIVPILGNGSFGSSISTNPVMVGGKSVSLGEFHAKLRDMTETPLKKSWAFPRLAENYNSRSHKAQRTVFEAGVVSPLLDATRQKLESARDRGAEASSASQHDALAALIEIEADILARGHKLTQEGAKKFLNTFEKYVAGGPQLEDTNMVSVMAWTYSQNEPAWPPRRFTGGTNNTLAGNPGIDAGLALFVRSATNTQAYLSDWTDISSLRDAVNNFAQSERALFQAATAADEKAFDEAQRQVQTARAALQDEMAKAAKRSIFTNGVLLTSAQQTFQSNVNNSAGAKIQLVSTVNDAARDAFKDYPLFQQIKERLDAVKKFVSQQMDELLKSGNASDFHDLDENSLAGNAFAKRADLYAKADQMLNAKLFDSGALVGTKGKPLDDFLSQDLEAVKAECANYKGKLKDDFTNAVSFALKRAAKRQTDRFFEAYLSQADRALAPSHGFPLVRDPSRPVTLETAVKAARLLNLISSDLGSGSFQKANLQERDAWKKFDRQVKDELKVTVAIFGSEGTPGNCTVNLSAKTDAPADNWREFWRGMQLVSGANSGATNRTLIPAPEPLGEVSMQQKFTLRLHQQPNVAESKTFDINISDWGPLWLVLTTKESERDKKDPLTWQVKVPLASPDAKGTITLNLKFDRPLPDLDQWPAM